MENDTYSMYSKSGTGTIILMDPEPVMSLGTEKVVILMAMTMITLVFGLLPYKLLGQVRNNQDTVSRARWRLLISLCTCVSGGVFLAACLLDLFPETEEKLAEVIGEIKTQYDYEIEYPVAHLLVCCGFFLILVIEQWVLSLQAGQHFARNLRESQK